MDYIIISGSTCYLLIETSDSEKIYNITTVDLVDMKGEVIQRHDLESLPETEGLYTSNAFDPPTEFFYLGVMFLLITAVKNFTSVMYGVYPRF